MAITATLVERGQHRLRYLITATDTSALAVTITGTGAATPDLVTDSAGTNGIIRALALAPTRGYGKLAAGVLTQAQARALWLADDAAGALAPLGQNQVSRARCKTVAIASVDMPAVDADVDGGGVPNITVTLNAAGSAYLDIEGIGVTGAIGA